MFSIRQYKEKLEKIADSKNLIYQVAEDVANKNKDALLSLNRDQLLLGRNTDGDLLSPDYLRDPYFKTPESANRYAKMKYKLEQTHRERIKNPTVYPNKPKNTPNLIVTGPFQDGMFIQISGREYDIDSTYRDAAAINLKYNNKVMGTSPESARFFFWNYIVPEWKKRTGIK